MFYALLWERTRARGHFAFSLIELLVVIAILSILATIAIPAISYALGQTGESKNRRNAQHLATLSAAIISAGHEGTDSIGAWITMLTNGVTLTNGFGETLATFRTVDLKPEDIEGLTPYISLSNSQLVYRPNGTN